MNIKRNGNGALVQGLDIPITQLVPRNTRKYTAKHRRRIEASLSVVGLIDPLLVFVQGDHYEILDGCLRYRIFLDWGIASVPCLISPQREAFSASRMVNQLSASQEMRMLRTSLQELDEKTIAKALGMTCIRHRLNAGLQKKLDPSVQAAFEAEKLNVQCVKELVHVKPDRQVEILKLMESCKDYSLTFIRGLVLKTPPAKRMKPNGGTHTPWQQADERKSALLKKLKEAEQQQDFYSGLYRQYSVNLLKLVIFVRSLLANARVKEMLQQRHGLLLNEFEQIITATEQ